MNQDVNPTLGSALRLAQQRIDRLDARLLLECLAGCRHADLIARPETALAPETAERYAALVERRAAGEPLAYLVGHAEFRGRRFAVSPDVLIPRPETEELVDLALAKVAGLAAPLIADLGTGSGAIAISLALECPPARVLATDLSGAALAVAQRNAASLGARVEFRQGDWLAPLAGERFDLIVSNPPYIAAGDPHLALNGLPHEPQSALTDGGDGLACIRAIVAAAGAHLRTGGWLLFEHGYDQGEISRNLLRAAGFKGVFTHIDLAGNERVSGGQV